MAFLTLNEKIKADCARFRPFGPNAMAGGFLGVIGHQGHAFGLGSLMVEEGRARGAEKVSKLGPGIRLAHVDDASRFDPVLSCGASTLYGRGVSSVLTQRQNRRARRPLANSGNFESIKNEGIHEARDGWRLETPFGCTVELLFPRPTVHREPALGPDL